MTNLINIAGSVIEDSQHRDDAIAGAIAAADVAVVCAMQCKEYKEMVADTHQQLTTMMLCNVRQNAVQRAVPNKLFKLCKCRVM
jgi:hypothetical protein